MGAPSPDIVRLRDLLKKFVPWWLSDRSLTTGKWVGFRFLWSLVAPLDVYSEWTLQALQAPWPGLGTISALPYTGRTRGIVRGQADTDAAYSAKLVKWLDKWSRAGSSEQLATEIHEYLGNAPMVRIVNRAGQWVTVNTDGSITLAQQAFNWDGVSHPERSGFWSDMWIIVYPTQWALRAGGSVAVLPGDDGFGLGHLVPRVAADAIMSIVAQWKSAHSKVRAIIWTSDSTLFNPAVPASLPDGTWGAWGNASATSRVAGGRNLSTCRYWEPV